MAVKDFVFDHEFDVLSSNSAGPLDFMPVHIYFNNETKYYYAFYRSHLQPSVAGMCNISFISAKSVGSIHLLVRMLVHRGFVFTDLESYSVYQENVLFYYRRKQHEMRFGIVFSEPILTSNY